MKVTIVKNVTLASIFKAIHVGLFSNWPSVDENGKLKIKVILNGTLKIPKIVGVLSNIILIFNFPSFSTEEEVEKRPLRIALETEAVVLSSP